MKAVEQYFHVILFTMLYKVIYKVVLTKSLDETLVCDHLALLRYCLFSCSIFLLLSVLWMKICCLIIQTKVS